MSMESLSELFFQLMNDLTLTAKQYKHLKVY